jgi:tetratricopeptide (TPR) repeat protein
MTKLDRRGYEAEIGDDAESYRNELGVEQIAPVYSTAREAFLPVRDDAKPAVEALVNSLAPRLAGFFHLRTSRELIARWRGSDGAALVMPPDDRLFVRIAHDSDRIHAGYENIYRTIRALAPHLEDCRFLISEDYDTWVDEYRIEAGVLGFERGWAQSDNSDAKREYFYREAKSRPDDPVWIRYCARSLAGSAHYEIDRSELPTLSKPEQIEHREHARELLERAAELDEDEPVVCAQMGRLLALEGHPAQADQWFERHAAATSDPDTALVAGLSAIAAGELEVARRWLLRLLEAVPKHQAAAQLLALLAARRGDPRQASEWARAAWSHNLAAHAADQRLVEHGEELHRAGLHAELLEVYLAHVVPDTPSAREALAAELLTWAELLRIKMCHEIDTHSSRTQAEALYQRALGLHPLAGRIHAARALFLRQAKLEGEAQALAAALEINPHNIDALGRLGTMALDDGDHVRAIELLGRAVDENFATGGGGYGRGLHASYLLRALIEHGNHLLETGEPEQLRAADALFEQADAVGAKVSGTDLRWHGALLRRSAAHTLLGEHEQALAFAQQGLALAPESVHAMSEIAGCLSNLGRYELALATCERAAKLDAGYWHVPYVKACALTLSDGELAQIIESLTLAIALDEPCRGRIASDPDFARVRARPEFRALLHS